MGKRTVQLAMGSRIKGLSVPFMVKTPYQRGLWAVTPFISGDTPERGHWVVTHVPSGINVNRGWFTLKTAKGLCDSLHERLSDFGAKAHFAVVPKNKTGPRWETARELCRAAREASR